MRPDTRLGDRDSADLEEALVGGEGGGEESADGGAGEAGGDELFR